MFRLRCRSIIPADNLSVALLAFGEGWHNYHHVFPYDYKTSELGKYSTNLTTMVIDFCSKMGLAYDLKTVPIDVVNRRSIRTGDGSRQQTKDTGLNVDTIEEVNVWGWGDQDMQPEEINRAEIINKSQWNEPFSASNLTRNSVFILFYFFYFILFFCFNLLQINKIMFVLFFGSFNILIYLNRCDPK